MPHIAESLRDGRAAVVVMAGSEAQEPEPVNRLTKRVKYAVSVPQWSSEALEFFLPAR